VTMMGKQSSNE